MSHQSVLVNNSRQTKAVVESQMMQMIIVMFVGIIIILNILLSSVLADDCKKFNFHPKPFEVKPGNKYGLWPDLASPNDLQQGETLYGFEEVS
jgi:hypothetical protein